MISRTLTHLVLRTHPVVQPNIHLLAMVRIVKLYLHFFQNDSMKLWLLSLLEPFCTVKIISCIYSFSIPHKQISGQWQNDYRFFVDK